MKKNLTFVFLLFIGSSLFAQAQRTFFVDFGPNDVTNGNITSSPDKNGIYWNNLVNVYSSDPEVSLFDYENNATEISIDISSNFAKNGILNGGLLEPNEELLGELAIPTATQDYFFTTSNAELVINNLNPGKGYIFSLFASRNKLLQLYFFHY